MHVITKSSENVQLSYSFTYMRHIHWRHHKNKKRDALSFPSFPGEWPTLNFYNTHIHFTDIRILYGWWWSFAAKFGDGNLSITVDTVRRQMARECVVVFGIFSGWLLQKCFCITNVINMWHVVCCWDKNE